MYKAIQLDPALIIIYLLAMFHCMIFRLYCLTDYKIDYLCTNENCIEFIVLFYNREFDLPWEVEASKGPARSSRPGRSRWFSEDPSALLYSNIASIVFMVLLYAWVLQYSLYCIADDALFFFLYNYLFSEFPVSLELPLYKLLKSFSDTCAS